ncbi:MAG: HAMP domain-containing sensor histidine kinase, partial [Patescibacteria group bacterium]
LFLLPSEPKMYFPNYYEPGLFNWTRMAFLYALVLPLTIGYLLRAYAESASSIEKNQYKFFALTMAFGYVVSFFPNFLVYDIPIDPMWGTLFAVFFAVPFVYGAVQYGLFNIKVIAKQAFWYGGTVALVGGFITFINFLDQWVRSAYPLFPFWILPLVSAVIAVGIGVFVWEKLRVADLLKYEFVNVVTHKFRTPLTYISWAVNELEMERDEGEKKKLIAAIRNASERLVGLTHILVSTVKENKNEYAYDLGKVVLSDFLRPIIAECREKSDKKNIRLQTGIFSDTAKVLNDAHRMQFVFQNIIENAILYTPEGGEVDIHMKEDETYVTVSVRDSGIGISERDLHLIFNDFFRSTSATAQYTEGMGVGLYISKNIVLSHDGKIWAESAGEGKGATFFVTLPKAD